MLRTFFFALAFALSSPAFAAEPTPEAKQEITYLLNYLKSSGCEFNRNGTWYGADEAVNHLNKKYDYLLKKGLLSSTEDFIKQAATESSMSSKPYLVKCGANSPTQSSPWFKAALAKRRTAKQ
ncbi:DUF5329 domain-containing protein [Oxalobacteraceae bacterium]|nr:DUF5329 domain-containing protein [Oxalobacteraceae bacterium]